MHNLLVAGGDRRMLHLAELLEKEGWAVETLGLRENESIHINRADAVLLPYPFSQRNGLIPVLTGEPCRVQDVLSKARRGITVLAGRGISHERAEMLAALAQGSVGRALEIDADGEYFPLRDRVIGALQMLKKPQDVLKATAMIGDDPKQQQSVLEIMELWARDLMRVQNGMEPLMAADKHKLEKSSCSGSMLLRRIIELRKKLAANVSWVNALESMDFALTEKN